MATHNLAIVFAQANMVNEGLLTIERAAMMDGDHACIKTTWALMALEAEHVDKALEASKAAVEQAPKDIAALWAYAMALTSAGMPDRAMPLYNKIIDLEPTHPAAAMNACFVSTLSGASAEDMLKQRQRWWTISHYTGKKEQYRNNRDPNRTIRIGYVGGDYKRHSAAFIFAHVLLHHTDAVEMYLYSTLPVDPAADPMTKKFMDASGTRWRDITTVSDEDADRMIRNDKIDILVDLAAHTNGGRLSLFTRKPAPVQVTAWGFAHGTGLPEIDYFFADPVAVPPEDRPHFAEKIVDLPCIVTMEEPTEYNLKGTSMAPFKRNGFITFGNYARFEKMSDECLKTFGEIMRRVPDAKMEFKDSAYRRPYSIRRVMSLMEGVTNDRLLFSLNTTHPDHMLAYQQADICLDPFGHGGGVVSLEQIYMGVPLITMRGPSTSGRSASSVLTAMGRTDWIAKTPEEYVAKAVEWADKPKELAEARKTLRDELMNSPVVVGYVAAVEAKYHEFWQEYCLR